MELGAAVATVAVVGVGSFMADGVNRLGTTPIVEAYGVHSLGTTPFLIALADGVHSLGTTPIPNAADIGYG